MLVVVLALSVFVPASAFAQQSVDVASVSGRVADPSGAVVPGATVTVRHTETNLQGTSVTDQEGRFRFPYLRVGPYELRAQLQGFTDNARTLVLSAGSAFDISITLDVGGIDTAVTVVADGQVLETARSQIAGTVPQAEVQNLPMNGRNFLDLALLIPGVSPTATNSTQLFAETSGVLGQGISIASQRNLSNSFIVDGLSANDDAAGLSGIPFGVDAIEQFQVVTGGGQAELGRALGGYVNVVTRSGTNTRHGTVYGFFRDDAFNGKNALTKTTLPMDQQQFGGSLGGPLVRNRTFYFANVERRLLDQTGVTTITPENVAAINTRLAQVAYQGQRVATGIYPNPVHSLTALGKVDHQFSGADQLSVRYAYYNVSSRNARGVGQLNAPSGSTGLDNLDQSVAVSNALTLSANTVNETRMQISQGDLEAYSTDLIGPQVTISGVATFGTFGSSPTRRQNTMFQAVNNLSHRAGAHALRAGVDFLYNDDTITFLRSFRGAYTFSSLANFLTGNYNGYAQTFGNPVVTQTNPNVGIYAQDEWRAGSRLTLNAGLRYDLQFLETINTDTNNVSPRFGFAWTPTASQDFVVRGGAGVFFDRVPLRATANALFSAGNTTDIGQLRQPQVSGILPSQAGAPAFPNMLPDRLSSTALVSIQTMDRNLQNAYSKQANVEVERTLGGSRVVSVGYQYFKGEKLLMSINQNVATCVAAGTNNGCRPMPAYANNNDYRGVGESNYHGLHLTFLQRPREWSSVRVAYTLSKSMNNLGEAFFSAPTDPTNIMKDWGRSDNDQRHRLVVSASVNSPMTPGTTAWERISHGFQASTMVQYYSSLPFNIVSGVNSLQGTGGRPLADGSVSTPNFDVRQVEFIPRNAGTGSDFFTVSLRVSRSFRLPGGTRVEGLIEAFNLTDRVNPIIRNTTFGPGSYPSNPVSSFNTVTAVGDPRTIQFGIRLIF
ncbi:MAG: TonB-dependent receptor [Acidobacteria bacterium]|nr:TonB-dependent receptor [Acidobacteriota bacterium]